MPGKTYVVGNPKGPNSADAGNRFIDGENGATIKCAVTGGGPFNFSGNIKALSGTSDFVTMTITNGVIAADKLNGTATIAINTPQLAATFTSPPGMCTLTVVGGNVKPGSVWATAYCPSVTDTSTGKACSIGTTTTFVFENCEGS